MNIQKKLILFYKKKDKLAKAKLKLKQLNQANQKLSDQNGYKIAELQIAADHYAEIQKYTERTGKLPGDLIGLQRDLVAIFKSIGLKGKKKVLIENSSYGALNFWYEGTYIYFEEGNS